MAAPTDREAEERRREESFLEALLERDFASAKALARFIAGGRGPGETSPYRGSGASEAFATFERGLDLLAQGRPVSAYFVIADGGDDAEHLLEPALLQAIGEACETAGERHVARAAFESAGNLDEAMRLESEIPLTRVAMDERVHAAGIAHHRAALEADRDDVDAMEGLALRLEAAGEHHEAAAVAKRTIARHPSRPGSHLVRVDALLADERADEALAAAELACEACPDAPQVWIKRGDIAFRRGGDAEAAIGHYRRALDLDETLADVHDLVANLLHVTGDREGHIAQLTRMLPLAPTADVRDRWADDLDRARAEVEGGEAIADAQRRIEKRREQRDEEIEKGLRVPDANPNRKTGVSFGSLLLVVMIVAVFVIIWKSGR